MAEPSDQGTPFVTAAMAEILLGQNMLDDAERIIDALVFSDPENSRFRTLLERLAALREKGVSETVPLDPGGRDAVRLELKGGALRITWEVTEGSLALARRRARYSGESVIRLFAAVPGPRGVRTSTRDLRIAERSARIDIGGLPRPAVYVAAAGFLANTGLFVPLAGSEPLLAMP